MSSSYILGTVCDFRLGYGRVLNKRSKIIAVNRNKEQLFKVRRKALKVKGRCLTEAQVGLHLKSLFSPSHRFR